MQRPLRVVLVCGRGAEHRHDGVADELVQGAAEPLDLGPQAQVVGAQHRADVLGVGAVRAGGEPDQVAEQHRDDLAFFTRPPALGGQPSTASPAEPGPLQRGVPAMWTSRHGQSLRGGGRRHRGFWPTPLGASARTIPAGQGRYGARLRAAADLAQRQGAAVPARVLQTCRAVLPAGLASRPLSASSSASPRPSQQTTSFTSSTRWCGSGPSKACLGQIGTIPRPGADDRQSCRRGANEPNHRRLELLESTDNVSRVDEALVGVHQREGWSALVLMGEQHLRRLTIDGAQGSPVPRAGPSGSTLPGAHQTGSDPRASEVGVDLADHPVQGPVSVTTSKSQGRLSRRCPYFHRTLRSGRLSISCQSCRPSVTLSISAGPSGRLRLARFWPRCRLVITFLLSFKTGPAGDRRRGRGAPHPALQTVGIPYADSFSRRARCSTASKDAATSNGRYQGRPGPRRVYQA